MDDLIIKIIYVVVTAVILPLITLIGKEIINRLTVKTNNERCATYLNMATEIVLNTVKATTQTFVDTLKKDNSFDIQAQKKALEMTKESAKIQISNEIKEYINNNCGDFEKWLETQIESSVNSLKKVILR